MKYAVCSSLAMIVIGTSAAAQSAFDGTLEFSLLNYDGAFDGDATHADLSVVYPLSFALTQFDVAVIDESIATDTSYNLGVHLIYPSGSSNFGFFLGQAQSGNTDVTYYGIEGKYDLSPVTLEWLIGELDGATKEEYVALDLTYRPTGLQVGGGDLFFTGHLSEFNTDIWKWDRKSVGVGWDSPFGATVELSAGQAFDLDTVGLTIGYQFGSGAIFERRDSVGVFTK